MEHFEKFESYIPVNLTLPGTFLLATGFLFVVMIIRYFAVSGLFWWIYYRWQPGRISDRQIYKSLPSAEIQKYEIKWSLATSVLFAFFGILMGLLWQLGWTQIYLKMDQYGWLYFFFSLFLVSFVHDFYYYVTHRLLHVPWFYRKFHSVHHNSLTPSPWASFSFHPVDGMIQAIALPLIVLIIPIHPVMLLLYLSLMTISGITNHLGFEILPKGSEKGVGKWLISGVHHSQHHRYFRYNYALFFTFWDHVFKTEHPKFQTEFRQVFEKTTA